jgi:hypothetical protein
VTQPLVDSDEVRVGKALAGVDTMEQNLSSMMSGHPRPIGVSDLIVDPDEGTPGRPADERAGFPVQPVPFILLILVGWLRLLEGLEQCLVHRIARDEFGELLGHRPALSGRRAVGSGVQR